VTRKRKKLKVSLSRDKSYTPSQKEERGKEPTKGYCYTETGGSEGGKVLANPQNRGEEDRG